MPESTFPVIGTSISSSRASLGNASLPAINDTRSSQQETYSMEIGVLSPLPCRATQVRKQGKRLPTKKRRRKSSLHWKMRASSMRHTSSLSLPRGCGAASAAPCNGGISTAERPFPPSYRRQPDDRRRCGYGNGSGYPRPQPALRHAGYLLPTPSIRAKKPPARSCKECWRYRVHQQRSRLDSHALICSLHD